MFYVNGETFSGEISTYLIYMSICKTSCDHSSCVGEWSRLCLHFSIIPRLTSIYFQMEISLVHSRDYGHVTSYQFVDNQINKAKLCRFMNNKVWLVFGFLPHLVQLVALLEGEIHCFLHILIVLFLFSGYMIFRNLFIK